MTRLVISLIKTRLQDTYGKRMKFVSSSSRRESAHYSPSAGDQSGLTSAATGQENVSLVRIIGEPTTPNEAATLAEEDKYQFQRWALGLVGARLVEQKRGADHGIDGKILFRDDPKAAKPEQLIIQVKGGKTGVKDVRDLRGVLDREKAAIGVLISLQPPTAQLKPLTLALSPSDGAREGCRERRFLRTQDEQAEVPAPPTAHREGVDGRQRHQASGLLNRY